eukprot:CAMPEP_0174969086 /NCGR_PEP_ID=MMETSP0004_2-20121128/8531_1 /TAXON_ID=420556 /ORGANISM="Ochromonas sp., Strain CCMP1393" /LENGTH=72 /DNA_ID=CAMNT_0016218465 /DNA_START=55 /DNA_END=273 /DNA_ORIENTATION=+
MTCHTEITLRALVDLSHMVVSKQTHFRALSASLCITNRYQSLDWNQLNPESVRFMEYDTACVTGTGNSELID